jgi:hypothetical protein
MLPQLTRNGGASNGAADAVRRTAHEIVDGEG